jgi:hypothetical protein
MISTLLGRALTMLGALALLSCAGVIALAMMERPVPDVLQNLAVGSMTAVGALLARSGGADPRPDQSPDDPPTRG